MRYHYVPGAVRWRRFDGPGDVRGYRPRRGWEATAELTDVHPLTGRALAACEWWIHEIFTGRRATRKRRR